jgi:hypothetical protein
MCHEQNHVRAYEPFFYDPKIAPSFELWGRFGKMSGRRRNSLGSDLKHQMQMQF